MKREKEKKKSRYLVCPQCEVHIYKDIDFMRKLVCSFKHDGEHARGLLDTLAIALVFIVFLSKKKKGSIT